MFYNNIIYLFAAIGLLPGGSGYFTCKQNMKLVTTTFKSEAEALGTFPCTPKTIRKIVRKAIINGMKGKSSKSAVK